MRALDGHPSTVYSLAFTPDGRTLVSGGKDGAVRAWDLFTGDTRRLASGADTVYSVTVCPDGTTVAYGHDGGLRSVSLTDGAKADFPASGCVCAVTTCCHGRYLIAGTGDRLNASVPGNVVVFDRQRGPKPVVQRGEPNGVWAVAADPLGKTYAWGGGGKRVVLGDLTSQGVRIAPQPHRRELRSLARSPDGQWLVAADDTVVRVLEAATGREHRQLTGSTGRVEALAFSPCGSRLWSAGWDRVVRAWDVASWTDFGTIDPGVGIVRALAVSPDGLIAAAAGDRGPIVVWDLD